MAKLAAYLRGEPGNGEVRLDRPLDLGDAEERQIAGLLLPASAEEVEVDPAVALAPGDDQPVAATVTPDEALEPVMVLAVTDVTAAVQVQHVLDGLVGLLGDERLMPAGVLDAVVLHLAHVVAVGQHVVEVASRYWSAWRASGAAGPEASGRQSFEHLFGRVLAGGEQLKAFNDERGTFGVHGDGSDLAAVRFRLTDVEVAEFGLPDGATVLDLLTHLVADVSTAGFGLVLVDRVQDGLDHGGFGVVTHVQHGRHDASTDLLQVPLDHAGVNTVSKDAVEVIDNDIVDVLLLLDPGDHFLEFRPFVDAGRRPAWFDKLLHDVGIE